MNKQIEMENKTPSNNGHKELKSKQKKQITQIKKIISEIKPTLKTISKNEKKLMNQYADKLYWEMMGEVSQDIPNWQIEEENLRLKGTEQLKQFALNAYINDVPNYIKISQLRELLDILLDSDHEDERFCVIMENLKS